jgi:hypothetical protein
MITPLSAWHSSTQLCGGPQELDRIQLPVLFMTALPEAALIHPGINPVAGSSAIQGQMVAMNMTICWAVIVWPQAVIKNSCAHAGETWAQLLRVWR